MRTKELFEMTNQELILHCENLELVLEHTKREKEKFEKLCNFRQVIIDRVNERLGIINPSQKYSEHKQKEQTK